MLKVKLSCIWPKNNIQIAPNNQYWQQLVTMWLFILFTFLAKTVWINPRDYNFNTKNKKTKRANWYSIAFFCFSSIQRIKKYIFNKYYLWYIEINKYWNKLISYAGRMTINLCLNRAVKQFRLSINTKSVYMSNDSFALNPSLHPWWSLPV